MRMTFGNIFLFPGHKYLGPGNELNNGAPVDSDDFIAKEHDLAYKAACTSDDVHNADKKAILAFLIDCLRNKNWHSAVGAIGLGLKHLTELVCAKIFYPKLGKSQSNTK